jgi:hypothetical protein
MLGTNPNINCRGNEADIVMGMKMNYSFLNSNGKEFDFWSN